MNDQEETRIEGAGSYARRFDAGELIDAYRIRRFIGTGRSAETYEVEHDGLGTVHALKVVDAQRARSEKACVDFRARAEKAAALRHANIVVTDDFGECGDFVWLRMELVGGASNSGGRAYSLEEMMAQMERLKPETVASILRQTAAGLVYAHEQGALHLNLKPSNVLLQSSGSDEPIVKLSDFLIAGSPHLPGLQDPADFRSPEQKAGAEVDARSDVYSLGLLAFYMLTGEPAVRLSKPSEIVPGLDASWDTCLERALASRPEDRYATVALFADALGLHRETPVQSGGSAVRPADFPVAVEAAHRPAKTVSRRKQRKLEEAERIAAMNNRTLRFCYLSMKEIKYFILIHFANVAMAIMAVLKAKKLYGDGWELIDFRSASLLLLSGLSILFAFQRREWQRPVLVGLCILFLIASAPKLAIFQESGWVLLLGSFVFAGQIAFPIYSATVFHRCREVFGSPAPVYAAVKGEFKARRLKSRIAFNGFLCFCAVGAFALTSIFSIIMMGIF